MIDDFKNNNNHNKIIPTCDDVLRWLALSPGHAKSFDDGIQIKTNVIQTKLFAQTVYCISRNLFHLQLLNFFF